MFYIILLLIILLILITFFVLRMNTFGAEATGDRLERMEKSSLYKNGQFHNITPTPALAEGHNMKKEMFKFIFGKKDPNLYPKNTIPHLQIDFKTLVKNEDLFIWLGHSSYYIQLNGKKFLIDPVFSHHGSPLPIFNKAFKGADTYHPDNFTEIDYLIITHDHYDHLDYPTVKALRNKVKHVILPLGVGAHFEKWGYKASQLIEEEWYKKVQLDDNLSITYTPARHFSGRKFKRNNTLWTSYILESKDKKIFLGGDSGYDSHFKTIGEKYGPFDYAILENGQYNEAWKYIHAMPSDIPQIIKDLKANYIIPVHSAKFALAKHAWDEPLKKIVASGKQNHFNILTPMIGESLNLDNSSYNFKEWWQ